MKKLLIIALAFASVNAFATRARVAALGGAPHLVDTQSVYTNPAQMFNLGGDFVSIESGSTSNTNAGDNIGATGAEGLVVRSFGDSKLGLSLGHDSTSVMKMRHAATFSGDASLNQQQNPIALTYGAKMDGISWAASLVYSNFNDKKNDKKENTTGLLAGMLMGNLDAYAKLGLANTASSGTAKFTGTSSMAVGGGYMMDSIYFSGEVSMGAAKFEVSDVEQAKVESTDISLNASNVRTKDNNTFFYGAGLAQSTAKITKPAAETKITSLSMPVWMGMEVDAASWMTLRGSITQSVLIADSKTETDGVASEEFSPAANSTKAAMGVGLKFNKVTIDGTLEGLVGSTQAQSINGSNLLATVGATYMF